MIRNTMTLSRTCLWVMLTVSPGALCAQTVAAKPDETVAEHLRLAQQYLREKKPDLAIPELRVVVRLDPKNTEARANLGVLLLFSGEDARALPELRAALAQQPNLPRIRVLLGIAEKHTGDLQAAQRDLTAAFPLLNEKKIRVQAGLELVETDQALGMVDKAAIIVSALRITDPANPQILSAAYQVYAQAENEALLSLAVAAPDSAELHFILGQRLVQGGNNAEALVEFRKALTKNPDLPGLHFEIAQLDENSADPALEAQAASEYKAALKVNPSDEKALSGLARIEADSGSFDTAAADYNKALALEPNDAEAATGLARVLTEKNEKEEATALLERAVRLDPTNITAHYRLSMLYRREGRTADAKQQLAEYEHYRKLKTVLQTTLQGKYAAGGMAAPQP